MESEYPYFVEVSYPHKLPSGEHIWIKTNSLRTPSKTGYVTGDERKQLDIEMAREINEALFTVIQEIEGGGLLDSIPSKTQSKAPQQTLGGNAPHTSTHTDNGGGPAPGGDWRPTYKLVYHSLQSDGPKEIMFCPMCKYSGKGMNALPEAVESFCKKKELFFVMCRDHQNEFWAKCKNKQEREELISRYKEVLRDYEKEEEISILML